MVRTCLDFALLKGKRQQAVYEIIQYLFWGGVKLYRWVWVRIWTQAHLLISPQPAAKPFGANEYPKTNEHTEFYSHGVVAGNGCD